MIESLAVVTAGSRGEEQPPTLTDPDESENESRSPRSGEPPTKKRLAEAEDAGKATEEATRRGPGRPQMTGEYVGRAEAIERVNHGKREQAELDERRVLLNATTGQLFSKLETDVEEVVDDMKNTPTAEVANINKDNMATVVRVTKCSKNLKGSCVKALKHAAVMGAATAEVLRTRADSSESECESSRQTKIMRKEIDFLKREIQTIRERADRAEREAQTLRTIGRGRDPEQKRDETKGKGHRGRRLPSVDTDERRVRVRKRSDRGRRRNCPRVGRYPNNGDGGIRGGNPETAL